MLKSSGLFDEKAQEHAQAAVTKATEDLVMRKYLMDRRPKEQEYVETPTVYLKSRSDNPSRSDDLDIDDDDEESDPDFAEDDDEVLAELRRKRLRELQDQLSQSSSDNPLTDNIKPKKQRSYCGSYDEIDERDFLNEVTEHEYVVCAFYHRDFFTCKVIDKHLSIMAQHHQQTRFIKINADKAPFFVNKLAVKMLPTIICFVDGVAVDRVVGFDDLGGKEDFGTHMLAARLAKSGVVVGKKGKRTGKKTKRTKVIS